MRDALNRWAQVQQAQAQQAQVQQAQVPCAPVLQAPQMAPATSLTQGLASNSVPAGSAAAK